MKQNFNKTYVSVTPTERFRVIQQINDKTLVSECFTGKRQKWWTEKHHPDNEIPTNIYLLGSGTLSQLHNAYLQKHGVIEWSEFINYTRELIKQELLK